MTSRARRELSSHGLLAGKTVVVTASAGTGIGFATARRCAEEGAEIVMSDKHPQRLAKYAADLAAEIGRPVGAVPCDVSVEDDVGRLFEYAIDVLGHVDVLVNNAARGATRDLVDVDDELWTSVLDVTLGGTFRCTRAGLRHMMPRGAGSIVNLGSVVAWRAEAGQSAYAAAKAGVQAMTRCAAMEAAPFGVRVNAVVPSLAMHPHLAKVSDQAYLDLLAAGEAFGRAAEPWEIADVVVFLASDLSGYLTGESLSVSCQHP